MENEKVIKEKEIVHENESNHEYASKGGAYGVGIPALALGGLAFASQLWGRNGGGILGLGGCQAPEQNAAPTAFQSWTKECDDAVALTNEIWRVKTSILEGDYAHRETDVQEKFNLWKSQVDADFGLYKTIEDVKFNQYVATRDLYDTLNERYSAKFAEQEKEIAVLKATSPLREELILCKIQDALNASINYTDKKTCKAIYGQVMLPNTPVLSGYGSYCCCSNNTSSATSA